MKKENVLVIVSVLILIASIAYTNCGLQVRPDTLGKQNTSSQTVFNPDKSLTELFRQPSISSTQNKPEIVFVLDTSASMITKVTEIKNAVTAWINQLSSQGINDFCLGTMPAKASTGSSGLLLSAAGNDKCYCTFGTNAVSTSVAITKFSQNMDAVLNTSASGGTDEAMIYSMHQAINDPAKLAANQSAGCFRNDTTLVAVLVSDEQDSGASPNSGALQFDHSKLLPTGQNFNSTRGNQYYNPGGADEAAVRRNYYCKDVSGNFVMSSGKYVNQIDHETLHRDLVNFNGSFPSFSTAIGFYPNNLPDPSIYSEPFWGGMQFAEEFDTEMVDLKDAMDGDQLAFQQRMNAMADAMASSILYFKKFDLSKPICDTDDDGDFTDEAVQIQVNGTNIKASDVLISSSGQKVTFPSSFSWSPDAEVKITYKPCKN
jgi:hypothetical protein